MRLLLIEDNPTLRTLISHHVSCRWPGAHISAHAPTQQGPIPPEFLAQGYDAVLLAQRWPGGDGLEWLRDLSGRPGFAPVIFLVESDQAGVREAALSWGAFEVAVWGKVKHSQLVGALERAEQAHRRQMADWRVSPEAQESRRFGDAIIPAYRRARVLARGAISQLYIAESEEAAALVVLKVTPSSRDATGVDQALERFVQEYEITRRIEHPSIVRFYEIGVADDHVYLAMEYFPLGDLRRRMRNGLGPTEALQIAEQLAETLSAIHAAGILHRDLKHGNVMMRTAHQIALIDFGLAKQSTLDLELTDKGLIFGTPHYMSPEQGHAEPVDGRSDQYSLGVMLHEMLTGQKPFVADNPMTVLYMQRNAPLPRLPGELAPLQQLLDRLLAKLPQHRYADCAAAARAIAAARAAWLAAEAAV